ncbi:calycin-like domain-containing protein [uncultured Coprobacter sp.]|jgi:hypothetical protein|uniref:calycin-like domain-containing protein n=1 Tax=uncultured Coprobacter sp. TaxID=1720550 RepID=UPI0025ED554C|nr:calycin-like domain-containing protein [uncultured Coprobacter sp.]
MKKNLFYLFIALFAVTFMTACGDDDDDKDKDTGINVAGSYTGTIIINIGDEESENPIKLENQEFTVTQNGQESINLSISGLILQEGLDPMNINVPNVPFSVDGEKVILNSTNLNIPLKVLGDLDAYINSMVGDFQGSEVSLKIVAEQELVEKVYITVTGTKK